MSCNNRIPRRLAGWDGGRLQPAATLLWTLTRKNYWALLSRWRARRVEIYEGAIDWSAATYQQRAPFFRTGGDGTVYAPEQAGSLRRFKLRDTTVSLSVVEHVKKRSKKERKKKIKREKIARRNQQRAPFSRWALNAVQSVTRNWSWKWMP